MRLILAIIILVIVSCSHSPAGTTSYWEKEKRNFKYRNKTNFFLEDSLQSELKTLKKVPLRLRPWIDSVYLYSWQERDPTKNEFTVVGIEGQYGPSIFYLIFDKKDSLLSFTRIAGTDDSGNIWRSYGATFFSIDSFYMNSVKPQIPTHDPTVVYVLGKDGIISVNIKEISDSSNLSK